MNAERWLPAGKSVEDLAVDGFFSFANLTATQKPISVQVSVRQFVGVSLAIGDRRECSHTYTGF